MTSLCDVDLAQGVVDDPSLNNISAINVRKTSVLINDFIAHSVDFLNKFASLAETKLEKIDTKMQKLEVLTALLEAKLEAIVLDEQATTTTAQQTLQLEVAPQSDVAPPPGPPPAQGAAPAGTPAPPPPPPGASGPVPTAPNLFLTME